jgi:hypothetical protein
MTLTESSTETEAGWIRGATSSYGLVACRCSAGQTVRGRAATAGACAEGGDGLRTSRGRRQRLVLERERDAWRKDETRADGLVQGGRWR